MSFSAWTQARTKKPMKPSLLPCFLSNTSLYWVRNAMMWLISTSLKVVSIAAVFCTSFRRRAMVWRSRVIFTRSSRAASSAGGGAGLTDRRRRRRGSFDGGQHVTLGDAAILAGARDGGGIDAALGGDLPYRRRQRRIGRRRFCSSRCGRHCGSGRRGSRFRRFLGSSRGCRRRLHASGAIRNLAQQSPNSHGFAVLGDDLAEPAGRQRGNL